MNKKNMLKGRITKSEKRHFQDAYRFSLFIILGRNIPPYDSPSTIRVHTWLYWLTCLETQSIRKTDIGSMTNIFQIERKIQGAFLFFLYAPSTCYCVFVWYLTSALFMAFFNEFASITLLFLCNTLLMLPGRSPIFLRSSDFYPSSANVTRNLPNSVVWPLFTLSPLQEWPKLFEKISYPHYDKSHTI